MMPWQNELGSSHLIHEARLLPFTPLLSQSGLFLRAAKVNWLTENRGRFNLSMQHEQRQHQEVSVQTKLIKPRALVLEEKKNQRTLQEVELGVVITLKNLYKHLYAYWESLPFSKHLSLLEVWVRLVGDNPEHYASNHYAEPLIQGVELSAMKFILQHISYFMGGVVADNLPEDFFWVQTHPTQWILCYDPIRGKEWREAPLNPLTLSITSSTLSKSEEKDLFVSLLSHPDKQVRLHAQTLDKTALNFFWKGLAENKSSDWQKYSKNQLERVLHLSENLNYPSELLIKGLINVLLSYGLVGLVVILERFEKLATLNYLDLFLNVYLKNTNDYLLMMESEHLVALDYLLRLPHDATQLWWSILASPQSAWLGTIVNFKQDIEAYHYFLAELQLVFEDAVPQWPKIKRVPSQPMKVTLSRVLLLLRQAVYPQEQLTLLPQIDIGSLWVDFALRQDKFRLIHPLMAIKPLYVGEGLNYQVDSLSAHIYSAHFNRYLFRFLGRQTWRYLWSTYLLNLNLVNTWAVKNELSDADTNAVITIIILTTTGKQRFEENKALKELIPVFLATLDHIALKYHLNYSSLCKFLISNLSPLEQTIQEEGLTLSAFNSGLTSILRCVSDKESLAPALHFFVRYGQRSEKIFATIELRKDWDEQYGFFGQFVESVFFNMVNNFLNAIDLSVLSVEEKLGLIQLLVVVLYDPVMRNNPSHFIKQLPPLIEKFTQLSFLARNWILTRLNQIDFTFTHSMWGGDFFEDLCRACDYLVEDAFWNESKAEKEVQYLSARHNVKLKAVRVAYDHFNTHVLLKQRSDRVLEETKLAQFDYITWRQAIPTLTVTILDVGYQNLQKNKPTTKIIGHLYHSLLNNFSSYSKTIKDLVGQFGNNPYQFKALTENLRKFGKQVDSFISILVMPAHLTWHTFLYTHRDINNQLGAAFFSKKNQPLAPDFKPFLKKWGGWLIDLHKEDWIKWLQPTVESLFELLAWFETLRISFEPSQFIKGIQLLTRFQLALQEMLRHPIKGKSFISCLEEVTFLLKHSKYEHTLTLLIRLNRDNMVATLSPLLEAINQMAHHLEQQDENLEMLYQELDHCEHLFVTLYKQQCQTLNLMAVVRELQEPEEATFIKKTSHKQTDYFDWFSNPTDSVVMLFKDFLESRFKRYLTKALDSLTDSPPVFDQLIYSYLGELDKTLSLTQALRQFQSRYDTLIEWLVSLSKIKHQLEAQPRENSVLHAENSSVLVLVESSETTKNKDFHDLIKIFIHFYEQGGDFPILIELTTLFLNYPGDSPVKFICALSQLLLTNKEKLAQKWIDISKGLKAAFSLGIQPGNEAFYLKVAQQALEDKFLFPVEKIGKWRTLPGVDPFKLNELMNALIPLSIPGSHSVELMNHLVRSLEIYIEHYPAIVSGLLLLLQLPKVQIWWLHFFPSNIEKGQVWFEFILAFSEQQPSDEEWDIVKNLLINDQMAFIQLYLYKPYPHKARFLSLLVEPSPARQTELLSILDAHPVWATSTPTEDNLPPILDMGDETSIVSGINTVLNSLEDTHLPDEFKQSLGKVVAKIVALRCDYGGLTRSELLEKQRKLQTILQSPAREEMSKAHLQWFALITILMYRTTGILPNTTQIIAVVISWYTKGHLLLQQDTGEGKSYVAALLAAWEWVQTQSVVVMSSNKGLVHQDFERKGLWRFFNMLGMPARILFAGENETFKPGFIYYSTPWDFSFVLSGQFVSSLSKPALVNASCIADECDWLLLKMIGVTFDYVQTSQAMNPFEWVYAYILDFINQPAFKNIDKQDRNVWQAKKDLIELRNFMQLQPLTAAQAVQWQEIAEEDLRLSRWIDAACMACSLIEGKDFLIMPEKQRIGYKQVVPIVEDVPQEGAQYSEGVQCFAHALLKKRYPSQLFHISPEVNCCDTDNPLGLASMFSRFIGLSATFGTKPEKLYLMTQLGVNAYALAPHEKSQRRALPHLLCENASAHVDALVDTIEAPAAQDAGLPMLIVEDNANHVLALAGSLKAKINPKWIVQVLLGTETPEELQAVLAAAIKPYSVTVITTLYARGLNLRSHHPSGMASIMACLREEEVVSQAFGRVGRYGQPGITRLVIDASRYGLLTECGKSLAVQEEQIKKIQARVSQESSIERYYTQAAALTRSGALILFDEALAFLLSHALTDKQEEMKKQLLIFREDWIAEIASLWKDHLQSLDPDNVYANPYIRRQSPIGWDIQSLESLLKSYPDLIQQAWLKIINKMMRKLQSDLVPFDDYAIFQWEWIVKEQTMPEVIAKFKLSKIRKPERLVSSRSPQSWRWDPEALAEQAEIDLEQDEILRKNKKRGYLLEELSKLASLSLEADPHTVSLTLTHLINQLIERIGASELDSFPSQREEGLRLISLYQQLTSCGALSFSQPSTLAIYKLKSVILRGEGVAIKLAKDLSWAKEGERTWHFWLSRPLVRRVSTDVLRAVDKLLSAESHDNLNEMRALQAILANYEVTLQGRWIFPWNKKIKKVISEAKSLLERYAPNDFSLNVNIGYVEDIKTKSQRYSHHIGFAHRQLCYTPANETTTNLSRGSFFNSWSNKVALQKRELNTRKQLLQSSLNTHPPEISEPWLPTNLKTQLEKMNCLTHALRASNWEKGISFGVSKVDEALYRYTQFLNLTWENIKEYHDPILVTFINIIQEFEGEIPHLKEKLSQLNLLYEAQERDYQAVCKQLNEQQVENTSSTSEGYFQQVVHRYKDKVTNGLSYLSLKRNKEDLRQKMVQTAKKKQALSDLIVQKNQGLEKDKALLKNRYHSAFEKVVHSQCELLKRQVKFSLEEALIQARKEYHSSVKVCLAELEEKELLLNNQCSLIEAQRKIATLAQPEVQTFAIQFN